MRLLHDWVLVELEPPRRQTKGGLHLVGPDPVRIARVVGVGPGRRDKKGRLRPTQVKVGDRFPFFKAATETKQGRLLAEKLPEGQELVRESDILFVIEGDGDVEVTL